MWASRRRQDYLWVGPAAVGWALYIVFGQKAGQAHGPSASTWGLIVAAVLTVPIGIIDAGAKLVDPAILPFGVAVAIFSSALPYTLEMVALRRLSTRAFGTLMSFEPALAALAGIVLLHERLSLAQWSAIAAIVVASVGAVTGERPESATERADFAP